MPCKDGPIDAAEATQCAARYLLYRDGIDVLVNDVAVETDTQVGQVADAQRRVEILVVGYEQWVHAQPVLDQIDHIVGILPAGHGDDAVVVVSRPAAVGLDETLQLLPSSSPVEPVLLFVNATARTDTLFIQSQSQRMCRGIQATFAELNFRHQISRNR